MERFVNHILYAMHLFTRNFEPAIFDNGRVSYNALLARHVFNVMLMAYLMSLFYTLIQLTGRDTAYILFSSHIFKIVYLGAVFAISQILGYIWFDKDKKEERYYWEFASMPDQLHLKWRFAAWGLSTFSIIYLLFIILW